MRCQGDHRRSRSLRGPLTTSRLPRPVFSTLVASIVLAVGVPVSSGAELITEGATDDIDRPCMRLAMADTLVTASRAQGGAKTPPRSDANTKELFRPLTSRELKNVLHDLRPVKAKEGDGWTIGAMQDKRAVDLQRAAVVLGDAAAMLALVQRDELLGGLRDGPGVDLHALAFFENAYQGIEGCLKQRFDPFGGAVVFEQTRAAIEELRPELEGFFFEQMKLDFCQTPDCLP